MHKSEMKRDRCETTTCIRGIVTLRHLDLLLVESKTHTRRRKRVLQLHNHDNVRQTETYCSLLRACDQFECSIGPAYIGGAGRMRLRMCNRRTPVPTFALESHSKVFYPHGTSSYYITIYIQC